MTKETEEFNFNQEFYPVKEPVLSIHRFHVYKNYPVNLKGNEEVEYYTIVAHTFQSVGEVAILGLKWIDSEKDNSIGVRTRLLIHTGDRELWGYILKAVLKTLLYLRINESRNTYNVRIEKRA